MEYLFIGFLVLIYIIIFNVYDKFRRIKKILELHTQSEIEKFGKKNPDFKISYLGNSFSDVDSYYQYFDQHGKKVLVLTSSSRRDEFSGKYSLYNHEEWLIKQGYTYSKREFGEYGVFLIENLLDEVK